MERSIRLRRKSEQMLLDDIDSILYKVKLDIVSVCSSEEIMGIEGCASQKIEKETSCHIRFSDNCSNHQEKSNQVSIAGNMAGVEKARAKIRGDTPITLTLDIPVQCKVNRRLKNLLKKTKVPLLWCKNEYRGGITIALLGSENNDKTLLEATSNIMIAINKISPCQIEVQTVMTISPEYHSVILGYENNNLKAIMQRTATQIMFHDASGPNIFSKNCLSIRGNEAANVYSARQQIIGSLPLILFFNVPEHHAKNLSNENVTKLKESLDVNIVTNIDSETKPSTHLVIITGAEKNASSIYEARWQLLDHEVTKVVANIPQTYQTPNSPRENTSANTNVMVSPSLPPTFCNLSPTYPFHLNHLLTMQQQQEQQQPLVNLDLSNVLSELTLASNARATSNEKKTTQLDMQSNLKDFTGVKRVETTFDYEQKKLMAIKAMQTKPNANDYRIPTSVWSGYGFSQTSPSIPSTETNNHPLGQKFLWKDAPMPTSTQDFGVSSSKDETSNIKVSGMSSNYVEYTSSFQLKKITSQPHTDLASMLTSVGLDKYIRLFSAHAIDVTTFPLLVEKDLIDIGISAWGARRKIMTMSTVMRQRTIR